jgi:hypothetical protein
MKFRKLRIAWSVFCGLACVLLIGMWVRSYTVCDVAYYRVAGRHEYQVDSLYGMIGFYTSDLRGRAIVFNTPTRYVTHEPVTKTGPTTWLCRPYAVSVFPKFWYSSNLAALGTTLNVPNWFATIIAAVLGVMPWLRWTRQFRLRTLLITTTLVAVVLGLIVYAIS